MRAQAEDRIKAAASVRNKQVVVGTDPGLMAHRIEMDPTDLLMVFTPFWDYLLTFQEKQR